jgi:predicted phosphodiesterase
MKIRILSDLHLEFAPFQPPSVHADVVVLAGDINLGTKGVEWAKQAFAGQTVIYVAGNHEFYRHHWLKLLDELHAAAAGSNVIFLEDEAAIIDGVRFVGSTLWTDFNLFGSDQRHSAMLAAAEQMNDFKKIRAPRLKPGFRDDYSKLLPLQTAQRFQASRDFLAASLRIDPSCRTVVVTHHLPLAASVPVRFEKMILSAAYASDLTDLVEDGAPDLWIHGHTHDSFSYTAATTRVVCNPRGYRLSSGSFENKRFDPGLVVEL